MFDRTIKVCRAAERLSVLRNNQKRSRHLQRLMASAVAPLLILLFGACSGTRKMTVVSTPAPAPERLEYRISPGDNLVIKLYYHPELNTEVWVRPDGFISLELVGEIYVAGRTPSELDSMLEGRYGRKLINPEVAVIVKNSAMLKVFVGGEVQSPGLVSIDGGMTLLGAIFQAGGFKSSAKHSRIVLLRKDAQTGRPLTMNFDLRGAMRGEIPEANIEVQPYDVIFVPKSGIAKANQFMDEFVEGLLPVSTLSGFAWVYALIK